MRRRSQWTSSTATRKSSSARIPVSRKSRMIARLRQPNAVAGSHASSRLLDLLLAERLDHLLLHLARWQCPQTGASVT